MYLIVNCNNSKLKKLAVRLRFLKHILNYLQSLHLYQVTLMKRHLAIIFSNNIFQNNKARSLKDNCHSAEPMRLRGVK